MNGSMVEIVAYLNGECSCTDCRHDEEAIQERCPNYMGWHADVAAMKQHAAIEQPGTADWTDGETA